jgi:CCR4-NOT transcription complex subunit 4
MDEVRTSIEALVADEPIDANIRQPPGTFEPFGRLKTPSVPPGLGLPSAHPSPAVSHSSLQATSTGRHTPPVALPKVPVKPPVATVSSPLSGKKTIAQPVTEAKKNTKALAAESGLSKEINSKAKSQKLLQDEEFPALGSPKPQRAATPVVQPKAPAGKAASAGSKKPAEKTKDVDTAKEEPVSAPARGETPKPVARAGEKIPEKTAEKKVDKRPVPGILNIAAATKAAQMKNAEAQSTDKSAADRDSAFPALPTPTAASVSSPLARTAPKTLRVVSTPKTETPSTPVNGPASILAAPVARAVAAAAIRPETPASELISDSASIISASISASRTNSPPPSKIGSAPTRATTKSQQRKQRKEALKKEAATISAQPAKAEPAEIAPIIGRKKKQKKDKPNSRNATPTESSSENPLAPQTMPADEVKENDEVKDAKEVKEVKEVKEIKEVREVKEESSTYRSTANETTTLTDEPHNRYGDLKGKMAEARKNLDHSTTPRIMPTPAAVLRDLQEAGLVSGNIDDLAFLKSVSAQLDKWKNDPNNAGLRDLAARNTMTPTKSIVTEDDQTALMAGNPVRKVVDGVRILLTPNGDCVRNLSPEEEDRFLELQQLVATSITNPAAFVSPRHEAGGGFSLIKGRAVPNGPPSYFPPGPGAYPSDPVNKIQREEAIYYINQYVLPRLNLNARDMSLPKAMSSWTTDPRGTAAQAAANLSSVAPWLYGGISPSSHGADVDVDVTADAAAPELNYPGPIGAFADPLHHIPHHLQPHSHPHFPHPGFTPYLDLPNGSPGSQPPLADETRDSSANSGNNTNASTNKSPMSYHSPGPFGNVPLMSLEDAEQALAAARKETEKLEKSLNQLMKKNRKLLLSMAGGAASSASPTATAVLAGGAASGGRGH